MSSAVPTGGILSLMRRLHPNPADEVSLADCYAADRPRPAHRPWIAACMVSGLDGSTAVARSSRGLSNATDTRLLLTLREMADVVLVGAETARLEGYGAPRGDRLRVAVVSRSGRFDFDSPLWTSGRAVLLLPEDAPEVPVDSIRAGVGSLDLAAAVTRLDADVVQCEGGPRLNGMLSAHDLIDELNLTLSPQITGGSSDRLTFGAPEAVRAMDLAHVLEEDGYLFTRWLRRREP